MKTYLLKLLFTIFLISFSSKGYSKGVGGYYEISFLMIDEVTKKPIANSFFIIKKDTIQTDENGILRHKINWRVTDRFPYNCFRRRKQNNIINRKILSITDINGKSVDFENKWRKYGLRNKRKKIYKKNIFW
ncbi:hypothetical protein WAF17_12730 [Bernardetia sp. ABR2-2B]|uniref:hypothetical protein n=1 Tax=Bernardetia sp. ABR2-2B TaxID=3127472 RepID=UPI0030CE67EA